MSLLPVFTPVHDAGPVLTFRTSAVDPVARTDYSGSFDGVAIGAAAADRVVIVGMGGGDQPVSAVTIGGVSATQVIAVRSATTGCSASFYRATVPTGTTADIDIVFSASCGNCGIGVWTATGIDTATEQTASDIDTQSLTTNTIDVAAGGVILGYSIDEETVAVTTTWAGITEQFDEVTDDPNKVFHSGASDTFATTQTNLTVSSSWTDTVANAALVVVSCGPS